FRLAHYVNVGLLGLGSLSLILAAQAYRGHTALSDAFCALLVLTPWQYETTIVYAYAYAMALACWCAACALAMTAGYLRSPIWLIGYLLLALVVTLAGGPAGNLWAIGLCGVLVRGWVEKKAWGWKSTALLGALVVVGISVALLVWTPRAHH